MAWRQKTVPQSAHTCHYYIVYEWRVIVFRLKAVLYLNVTAYEYTLLRTTNILQFSKLGDSHNPAINRNHRFLWKSDDDLLLIEWKTNCVLNRTISTVARSADNRFPRVLRQRTRRVRSLIGALIEALTHFHITSCEYILPMRCYALSIRRWRKSFSSVFCALFILF